MRSLLLALGLLVFSAAAASAQVGTYVPTTITALGAFAVKSGSAGTVLTAPITITAGTDGGSYIVTVSYSGPSAGSITAGVSGGQIQVTIGATSVIGDYQLRNLVVQSTGGITSYARTGEIARVGYTGTGLPTTHAFNFSVLDFSVVSAPPPQAPVITTQPADLTVKSGQSASFTVAYTSPKAATVQWRKDGSPLAGATAAAYTISTVAPADAGQYDAVITNVDGSTTTSKARLTVTPGYIKNISVRIVVADGGILTAGFVIDSPKTVLVRGIGKSLERLGVPAGTTMPNPKLEVYRGSLIVAANDDYTPTAASDAVMASVGAFAISSAQDAALVIALGAGAYTVQLSPVGGKGGDALVEVYEIN